MGRRFARCVRAALNTNTEGVYTAVLDDALATQAATTHALDEALAQQAAKTQLVKALGRG